MIRFLLLLPLLVLLVLFGLSNRHEASFKLWPFDVEWVAPLSVAVLIFAALAFLLGAIITWLGSIGVRNHARRMEERVRLLQGELEDAQKRQAREVGPVPPLLVPRLQRPAA